MKRKLLYFTFFLFFCIYNYAQDPGFTNSNASPILLNPSYAGSNGLIRSNFSYYGRATRFESYSSDHMGASVDAYLKPLNGGLAMLYKHEGMNSWISRKTFDIIYAQYFNFLEKQLVVVPSLQAGYGETINNSSWMLFDPPPYGSYLNLNSGLLINYKKNFFAGASLQHLNKPDVGYENSYMRLTLHSSYSFHIGERSLLQVLARYDRQQSFSKTNFSVNSILFKHFILGISYSTSDQVNLIVGGRLNSFSLQFGYNNIYSKLSGSTSSNYEMHLSYNLRKKDIRSEVPLFEKM